MKKLICLILMLALMVCALTACGNSRDPLSRFPICKQCGGAYRYAKTVNSYYTYYVYACDTCGREDWSKEWLGK